MTILSSQDSLRLSSGAKNPHLREMNQWKRAINLNFQ